MSRRNTIRKLFENHTSKEILKFADSKLRQPYANHITQYDWAYAVCFEEHKKDSEIIESIIDVLDAVKSESLKSRVKKILVLGAVFVLSQVLNKRQTEKVLRKIGLDMPEKTKYKIRDGLYFDFCVTGGEMT